MPVTCGRTSATRKAVVRPGSWSVILMGRALSVMMLTSGGGGGPPCSLPQPASASSAIKRNLFLFGIARSIGQHAGQEIVELRELVFLEAIEMHVHTFDDDGPDLVGHLSALGRQ